MKQIFLVVLCAVVIHGSHAHRYALGHCPQIDHVPSFNISAFLGRWYVIQKSTLTDKPCLTYNIEAGEHEGHYKVTEITQRHKFLSSALREASTTSLLTIPDPSTPALMALRAPLTLKSATVTVFRANKDYLALFTCKKWLVGHRWSAEILSRAPTLKMSIVDEIGAWLATYGIDPSHLTAIQQDGCVLRNINQEGDVHSANNVDDPYLLPADVIR